MKYILKTKHVNFVTNLCFIHFLKKLNKAQIWILKCYLPKGHGKEHRSLLKFQCYVFSLRYFRMTGLSYRLYQFLGRYNIFRSIPIYVCFNCFSLNISISPDVKIISLKNYYPLYNNNKQLFSKGDNLIVKRRILNVGCPWLWLMVRVRCFYCNQPEMNIWTPNRNACCYWLIQKQRYFWRNWWYVWSIL